MTLTSTTYPASGLGLSALTSNVSTHYTIQANGTMYINTATLADATIIASPLASGGKISYSDELPGQMTFDEVVAMEYIDHEGKVWEACCDHCECDPDLRTGHDDTCGVGCND